MKLIFKYLKKYWLPASIAPLMVMIGVTADLAQPTLMAAIIDDGIARGDMAIVGMSGLKMLIYSLIGMGSGIIMSFCVAKASTNAGADLREDLFRKIQTLSYGNLDRLKTGSLITRLTNDVAQVERIILFSLRIVIRAPLKIIGSLIMAVIIGRQLSLILVVISPLIVLAIFYLVRKAYPYFSTVQDRLDKVNSRLQENLSGIRLVKAFLREEYEQEKFKDANDELIHSNIRANRLMALMHPMMQLLMNTALVGALWFGGAMVGRGDLPVGKIMAFINYLTQMLFMLTLVSNVVIQLSRAQVSVKRISQVLDEEAHVKDSRTPWIGENLKGTLSFEDVSFHYGREKAGPVLENISFTLEPGETLAVMGATGSGKSTLAQLIPRFYDVTQGRITIDGRDIREISKESLRRRMAVVPQTSFLFSGSLEKNILFGLDDSAVSNEKRETLRDKAAGDAAIKDFIETLPDGYETDVSQRGVNLSGGQKQRLTLARALVRNPDILILDDSTSAVDLKTEKHILDALEGRPERSTCIIIAQRISTVKRADKILLLEEGRMTALGSHKELWKTSPMYKDICLSQLEEEEVS